MILSDLLGALAPIGLGGAAGALAVLGGQGAAAALSLCVGVAVAAVVASRGSPRAPSKPELETAEQRHTHEQLAETIAEFTPDAVLFFSDTGLIKYANPAAQELFFEGASPVGRNFLTLIADAPGALREALLGESDRLFTIDWDAQHETFHVSRRNFALGGELHTLLLVKHLTREISRREVEVLKQVIRVISHEVNNTLAPISSLVHSARLISKSPEHAPKLDRVFDTVAERATHLQQFLDGYAKLARLPRPRPANVTWGPFLGQLAELYPSARLPETPPDAPGYFDAVQIEQVLINLLKNAVEAGSAPEDVELSVAVDPNGTCELKVLDRGPGFSPEALKSAVLPLYTTKERGSGMGLALCREIVEAHGGALGIQNRPDGGASIVVRLPGQKRLETAALSKSRLTLTRS